MMEPFGALAYVSGRVLAAYTGVLFEEGAIGVADLWADVIYKLILTGVALGTVFWGYYRFVRGRTYRRKLTTSVSGTVMLDPSRPASTSSPPSVLRASASPAWRYTRRPPPWATRR
jgi:hypothetical protein